MRSKFSNPEWERRHRKLYNGKTNGLDLMQEIKVANNGRKYFVSKYYNFNCIVIEFLDNQEQMYVTLEDINNGIFDLFVNSPIYFEDMSKGYKNTIFKTKQGYLIKIKRFKGPNHIIAEFIDMDYRIITSLSELQLGNIKYPYHLNNYNGYIGEGIYNESHYFYPIWIDLLKLYKYKPNTIIMRDWFNFNNFATWLNINSAKIDLGLEYNIDSNILYSKYRHDTNNYITYGSNYSLYVPKDISILFIQYFNTSNEIEKDDIKALILNQIYDLKNKDNMTDYTFYKLKEFLCP